MIKARKGNPFSWVRGRAVSGRLTVPDEEGAWLSIPDEESREKNVKDILYKKEILYYDKPDFKRCTKV